MPSCQPAANQHAEYNAQGSMEALPRTTPEWIVSLCYCACMQGALQSLTVVQECEMRLCITHYGSTRKLNSLCEAW